jgi:hypothetical protein
MASWGAEIIHHQAAAAADRGFKVILGKAPIGRSRAFDDPIDLPGGRQLLTLKDAADGGPNRNSKPNATPSRYAS